MVVAQEFQKGCLIGNFSAEMARNDDVRARLKGMYKAWTDALATCIQQVGGAGKLKSPAPAEAVVSFPVSAWEGTILRAKVERDQDVLEQFEFVVFPTFFG
ncbi:TetR family transcriptional regulator C-terminal domain-containing protein [Pseudomonas tolaasii]|uniref:TetR family transcriptional regulator C-terminal domain-containing protein n=1 Tax=Pseudomonas tolaasii TaxID=29442 RepID=UPI00159F7621|nr:TetR family transcriptional regulator C-terminal domain-containing protein [Pseudomonas tolaasii]NWC29306.1 TetR family transcriptional regulator C-terminal domain-containing protein [Pseudomonas tolaasii]